MASGLEPKRGSSKARQEPSFTIREDVHNENASLESKPMTEGALPLTSSKLSNRASRSSLDTKHLSHNARADDGALESLVAKLSHQQELLEKQKVALLKAPGDVFSETTSRSRMPAAADEVDEVERLRKQLEVANTRIALQEHELSHNRTTKPAFGLVEHEKPRSLNAKASFTSNFEPTTFTPVTGSFTNSIWNNSGRSSKLDKSFASLAVSQPPQYRGFTGAAAPSTADGLSFDPVFQNRRFDGQSFNSFALDDHPAAVSGYRFAYQPRPIGTPLSPTAAEFTTGGPWNAQLPQPASPAGSQTYIAPVEPLNYRRLLDRSISCNWKYIVDKIVCNNDQQASIFLQQKLKVGTTEQKYSIVEAIVAQAYPLMVNRFGNFLVQRCFEHGTPEQVVAIANAIRGNTLSLSMDAFGCHVVQKAFDSVPEEYKAIMVHELLRRIPETVVHRYACHVWQKLFELRWSDSPPQIMKYVNEALRGMWHEVALGETGSLVVQNIFENCLEEDKRPCINEVLQNIDVIAHGQFGNWCIQHICEHGSPADRSFAIDHVLRFASEYSTDQFASKVVEKCLKIGGSEFLDRYLTKVCKGRPDRPRIPLVDIASDQYGNYLIQHILTNASATHRELVASHIRKHMVSLRGSKFGSRVGMLCNNPAYATRPGPGVPQSNRFTTSGMPRSYPGQFR